MKTWVIYFNIGEPADRATEVQADDVRHAVDMFIRDHVERAETQIIAIIEKKRTL